MSKEIITYSIKQGALQGEVHIIFNSSIASKHWADTLIIVSESMLVQCTKFKAKLSQLFDTTNIDHSEQGVLNRFYRKEFVKYAFDERFVLLNGYSYSLLFLRSYFSVLPIGNSA